MVRRNDDWRLASQERYLKGAELAWRRYSPRGEPGEHDHCDFCWATFMDPGFSESYRRYADEHPAVCTEGYTTTASHDHGPGYHWVCQRCFDDFSELFSWRVVP